MKTTRQRQLIRYFLLDLPENYTSFFDLLDLLDYNYNNNNNNFFYEKELLFRLISNSKHLTLTTLVQSICGKSSNSIDS